MITFFTWFSRFISWWSSKIFFSWWCSSVFLSVGLLPGFSFSFPLTSFFSLSSSFSLFMFWPTFLFCSDNPEGGSFSTWCSSLWKALSSSPFPKSHIKKYYKKLMVNCCFHSNFLLNLLIQLWWYFLENRHLCYCDHLHCWLIESLLVWALLELEKHEFFEGFPLGFQQEENCFRCLSCCLLGRI